MCPSPRRNPEETAGKKLIATMSTISDNTNTKGQKEGILSEKEEEKEKEQNKNKPEWQITL